MTEPIYRIAVRDATVSGPIAGQFIVIGRLIDSEPEMPVKREVVRPVKPGEPDTETEVGYSRRKLEPLTLVFRDRKTELTKSAFILFRYVYDLYRTEGQMAFDFAELSEVLTGSDCGKSKNALGKLVRRIALALAKIVSPISLTYERERLYVVAKVGNEK